MLKVAIVVGIFISALIYAYYSGTKRVRQLEAYATTHGWSFSRVDTKGFKERLETLYPNENFNFYNLMETGPGKAVLFECSFSKRTRNNAYFAIGGLIETPKLAGDTPAIGIFPRFETDKWLDSEGIELGSNAFRKVFHVSTAAKSTAERLVNAEFQASLLEHAARTGWKPVRIALGPRGITVFAGPNRGEEAWPELLALLARLEGSFK